MPLYSPILNTRDVEILARDTVFQGFFAIDRIVLKHRLHDGGWSDNVTRELFRRDRAAGVLLHDPLTDQLVMVEQFRVGLIDFPEQSPWALELVAGILEPGEQAEEMARREVAEEAGLQVGELEFICDYFNSPGGSSERISLFYGQVDARQADGVHGVSGEHEDIKVVVLSLAEAWQALEGGRINNAMAIIALQWLRLRQNQGKELS